MDQHRIFGFLLDRITEGKPCVLLTVVAIEGSTMRAPGTHMAICEDGRFTGSLSGGCIEQAVIAEALDTLKANGPRIVRFGKGSPYLDIRLPCGGGMDIHFQPLTEDHLARHCMAAIAARQPFSIAINPDGARFRADWHDRSFDQQAGTASFGHWPSPRLVLVGHGACMTALAKLAQAIDLEVCALTPDDEVMAALVEHHVDTTKLSHLADTGQLQSDPWTAIAFLFHDHDWEIPLMRRALELPHFYIGAMGSRRAHEARRSALLDAGEQADHIDKIRAPIGIFHAARDSDSLALSALAEIICEYGQADFALAHA